MRERWFGATGRKVPEIALEGRIDVEGALVLDGVKDLGLIHDAHVVGRPIVVRASTPGEIAPDLRRKARSRDSCRVTADASLIESLTVRRR